MVRISNIIWNRNNIFKCIGTGEYKHQKYSGGYTVVYYECELLRDFGPFKKGYNCRICIDMPVHDEQLVI